MGIAELLVLAPTALAAMNAARSLAEFIARQLALGKQEGKYTDEQIAQVRAEAGIVDAQWDDAVAAAKQRLGIV